ncbi:MAG: hypothetical protein IKC11_00995 [Clostridia bacterium]|nr:hypothetical protein [Clostridia bacterium]
MNATLIPSIIVSIFLIFVILGFVFGWFRGLYKSLIRFIMVLGMGVLAFFVIPPLAEAILSLDISKMNIIIGDVQVITIKDLVTDLLRQIPIVEDIIEASPTFETFIEILPMMIANVLLFVVFFFIFKWVSMVIYWIVAGVFFSKKKTEGKEKHGFIGAVIGALQGFVVACIVFVPIFGMVQTSKPVIMAVQQEQQASVEGSTFIGDVYYAEPENPEGGDGQTSGEGKTEEVVSTVGRYTKAFEDCWVAKMLDAIGVKKLSVSMFDKLSTIEQRNVEYSLMRETEALAEAYPELKVVIDEGFDIEDNVVLDALKTAINDLYESPVLSGMVKEIVPEIADRWLNDGTFCQISKPNFEDASIQRFFDVLLLNLSTSSGDTIKNDITTGVDLLMIANNANLLKTISNDGDIIELLSKDENKNLIDDIITKALESTTLKSVLPELINVAMDFVYRALDIDPIPDDIGTGITVDWEFEKPRLVGIFTNVIDIVDKIKEGKNQEPPVSALESLDFAKLGATFDNIRYSTLLGPASKQIMNALLSNINIVGDEANVMEKLITALNDKDNDIWDDKTIVLEDTFVSIGEAIAVARELQNNPTDFDPSGIGQIITDLVKDANLKDVVNAVVSTDTLTKLGLDEQTAGVVNETLESVVKGDYTEGSGHSLENEVKAVEEVFDLANKVINLDTTTDPDATVDMSEEEAGELVTSLANSTILLDEITASGSNVENLNLDEKLSDDAKANILTEVNKLEDTDPAKAKLLALFGIAV